MNISDAVRKVIARYPYLEDYLSQGLVNYRALARTIAPEVKREVGREANISSVVTALRRLRSKKAPGKMRGIFAILAKSDVNLKYDMAALTAVGPDTGRKAVELRKHLGDTSDAIIIQGMENLTLIAGEESMKEAKHVMGPLVVELKESLSFVVVKSPTDIARTPGVIAHLASILALEDINVVEMVSSFSETHFVVEERDALPAVEIIRSEIKRARDGG